MRDILLALIYVPDPQSSVTYGKWCQRFLWHQLASPFLNRPSDGYLLKINLVSIFSLFSCFVTILSCTLILSVPQLQTTNYDVTN